MKIYFFTLFFSILAINTFACTGPVAGVTHGYPGKLCMGSVITLTNDTSGGAWISRNTALATVGASTGVVTPVMAGMDTILYVMTDSCGSDTVKTAINIIALPVPFYSSSLSVGAYCLFSIPAGATMSAVSGAAIWHSGTDTLHGASAGIATFTVSDSAGCTSYDTVHVGAYPVVGAIQFSATLHGCSGNSGTLSDTTMGGAWSSTNTSVASVNATTGGLSERSAGVAIISYTVTGSGGTGWYCAEVYVDQVPANITGNSHVCRGSEDTLSTTDYWSVFSSTRLGVSWSSSDTAIVSVAATTSPSVTVTGVQYGTVTLTATSLNSGCSTTTSITVDTLPLLSPIAGTTTLCSSTTTTLTETVPGGVWSSSNTTIGTVSPVGVVTGLDAGNDSIVYRITNSCGYIEKADLITVNPLPALDLVTGSLTLPDGMTETLADPTTGGAWTSSNSTVATVDVATGVVTGVTEGSVIITYTVTNSFGCTNFTTFPIDVTAPEGVVNMNNNGSSAFSLYPNPVKGLLHIGWTGMRAGNANLILKDVTGRTVFEQPVILTTNSGSAKADISRLKSGIYFLTIVTENNNFCGKVVVE